MEDKKSKIIVIAGPTASGKSALAIKLAKKFNGEIVSADSRQVYRGMDIGTAKPTKKDLDAVPHHLIDIKNPDQNYTVSKYKRDAIQAINKILKNKKLPILVGGTGLYIKAVVDNLNIPEVAPDIKLRNKLEKDIESHGLKYVFEKLVKLDPEAAYIVDPNNPRRIIRALEIAIKTKKPFSAQRKIGKPLFDFIEIGIEWPKNILDERINKRVDLMIKEGLLKEVKNLIKKYGLKQQSFDAIGYREIIEFVKNKKCQRKTDRSGIYACKKSALSNAKDLIKKNTRNYAKRQMTWFKKDKRINWIKNQKEAEKIISDYLSSFFKISAIISGLALPWVSFIT